jgi:hypothetical protein
MRVRPPLQDQLEILEAALMALIAQMSRGRCRIVPSQHLECIEHSARLPEVDLGYVPAPTCVPSDRGPLEHLRVAVDEAE